MKILPLIIILMMNNGVSYSSASRDFSGSSQYIDVGSGFTPASGGMSNFTYGGWIYAESNPSASGFKHMFGFHQNSITTTDYTSVGTDLDGADLKIKILSLGETPGNGATISLNEWNHVMVTWNGSQFSAYLNGSLDYSVTPTGSDWQTATDFGIGREPCTSCNAEAWDGKIMDVRIYNRALSAAEIKEASQCLNSVRSGLMRQFMLIDPGTNPTFVDVSTNSATATNNGTTEAFIGPKTSWCSEAG